MNASPVKFLLLWQLSWLQACCYYCHTLVVIITGFHMECQEVKARVRLVKRLAYIVTSTCLRPWGYGS